MLFCVVSVMVYSTKQSKAASNVGTLPRLAPPLFIQLPKPFAQDDDDSDDDLKHDDERNEKDSRIILLSHFMVNAFNVDLGNTI